jgi:hypothetical protein
MDWQGVTNTPSMNFEVQVYGEVNLIPEMSLGGNAVFLVASDVTCNFTSAGHSISLLQGSMIGTGRKVLVMEDALTITSFCGNFTDFQTSGFPLIIGEGATLSISTLADFGGSTVDLGGTLYLGWHAEVDFGTSTINMTESSSIVINANGGRNIIMQGIGWTISKDAGLVSLHDVTLSGSTAIGEATFNAFTINGNVDGGGNTGWYFTQQIIQYLIEATTHDNNGIISPSGSVLVGSGSDQTFTITPNTNYDISDILVDSSSVGVTSSYVFTNVTSGHTIEAFFIQTPQPLTPENIPIGVNVYVEEISQEKLLDQKQYTYAFIKNKYVKVQGG